MILGVIFGVEKYLRVGFWFDAYEIFKFSYSCKHFYVKNDILICSDIFNTRWVKGERLQSHEDESHTCLIPKKLFAYLKKKLERKKKTAQPWPTNYSLAENLPII